MYGHFWVKDDLTYHKVYHVPDVEKLLFIDVSLMVGIQNVQEASITGEVCGRIFPQG